MPIPEPLRVLTETTSACGELPLGLVRRKLWIGVGLVAVGVAAL